MARFLFNPISAAGHVGPALVLAGEMVRRGHDVAVFVSSRFQTAVERVGARHVGFQSAQDYDLERVSELFPERPPKPGIKQFNWDLKYLTIDTAVDEYADLVAAEQDDPPDVIVADIHGLAGQFFAEKRSIPLAILNVVHLFLPSVDVFPDSSVFGPSQGTLGRLRNRTTNWLFFDLLMRSSNRHLHQTRAQLGLRPLDATMMSLPGAVGQLFLQPTVPELEYPRVDLPPQLHFIGPLLPADPPDWDPPSWWQQLDEDRPVVLVNQGTIATDFDDLIRPTLAALADVDVLVIATTGKRPVDEIKDVPANAVVESFVPFRAVMPHVDVMVTNGGYGGIHFALAEGVPLVVAGRTEDKVETTARVAWSGVGIDLKTNRPTPAKLREAVRTALDDDRFRERARELESRLNEMDGPTLGANLLERLVASEGPLLRADDPWSTRAAG